MNMDEIKYSNLPRQVTLKHKVTMFIIFYIILNLLTFGYSYGSSNMQSLVDYVDNINVDGTGFTLITNLFIGGFNGVIFMISLIANFIMNLLLIFISLTIFNRLYFKTICADEAKFINYIKKIIWIVSLTGFLINIGLNLNHGIIGMFSTAIITMIIYLPLPILTHILFFKNFNKVKTLN